MNFLAPAFLAALGALAIPIAVHLTHRHRREVIRFPSLRFVEQVPYRAVRRQRIRHWLLFVARSLAVVLIALAFARPFVGGGDGTAGGSGGSTEYLILLDASYSMQYDGQWDRARAAARELIRAMGPGDRAALVTFADDATLAIDATSDQARLMASLDTLAAGAGRTRYAPALHLGRQLAARSTLGTREVVLISDFQAGGWDRSADVRLAGEARFRPIDLSVSDAANVLVTEARVLRGDRGGREEVFVLARLVAQGSGGRTNHPVVVEIDGRIVERKTVTIEAKSAATVRFGPLPQPATAARVTVRSADDELDADNAFHFVLAPRPTVPVLLIDAPGRRNSASLYLRQALEISQEPAFVIESRASDRVRTSDVADQALVILNDAPFPQGAAGTALVRFVEAGGGLFVVLGRGSAIDSWPTGARALLPGIWGAPADGLPRHGVALGTVEYAHPILAVFNEPESGDLSSARFYRYRTLTMDSAGVVLARYTDGSVALALRTNGNGKTLLLASSLDNVWNDLPLQPVYLPLVHQIARHLGGRQARPPWHHPGQIIDLHQYHEALGIPAEGSGELIVEAPSGHRVSTNTGGPGRFLPLTEPGFYGLRAEGRRLGALPLAVNADRAESDLRPLDADEFAAAVTAGSEESAASADPDPATLTLEEREQRQGLWWYLLIAALILLVAESVASNRLPHTARTARVQEALRD